MLITGMERYTLGWTTRSGSHRCRMNILKQAAVSHLCLALMFSGCSSMSTPSSTPTPGPPPASAQAQPPAITEPELQASSQNDPSLTQGENVERMDRALARSLNKYDTRRNAQSQAGGGSSPATAGSAADTALGADGGAFPELGPGGSLASSEISGTETNPQVPAGALGGPTQVSDVTELSPALGSPPGSGEEETPDRTAGRVPVGRRPVLGSGKLPEDIPAADNDSVLEAQIRAAAMQEQDPDMRERLWNEYRRYKGLSVQE